MVIIGSQSGGQVTVDTGHPLADASVPRVAITVSNARVTPGRMGESGPQWCGSPGQMQVEGQRSGV